MRNAQNSGERVDARSLYTKRVDAYLSCNALFRASRAYQAFFESYDRLRPDLRILDAGCGTGLDALALIRALDECRLGFRSLDAFDLTPAMLVRFRESLDRLRIQGVRLREADVLDPRGLPDDWSDYDLIVSAAMLEYVPRGEVTRAIGALRARLAPHGTFLLFITRRNWITSALIAKPWEANCYRAGEVERFLSAAEFRRIEFRAFPAAYFWHNCWAHVAEASTDAS